MVKGNKIDIGIVGCGNISDTHAEAINASEFGNLVAVCTRNPDRLRSFSNKYSIPGYHSYDEFLKNPNLDVVSICTPSGTHLNYGKKAAEAGKHVIVEKPIEINVARGFSLVEACRKYTVKLAVIYQNRFIESVVRMKEILGKNGIGKPFMASASVKWFRDKQYYSQSDWRGTFKLDGGGAVINQSIHTIDLLQWLLGDVESVYAYTINSTHEDIEAEDNAIAVLKFLNETICVFQASTSIVPSQDRRIEVNGKKGTLILEGDNLTMVDDHKKTNLAKSHSSSAGAASPLDGLTFKNHLKQYEKILNAINNSGEMVISGEESLKSLAVVEAIYKSSKINQPVCINSIYEN